MFSCNTISQKIFFLLNNENNNQKHILKLKWKQVKSNQFTFSALKPNFSFLKSYISINFTETMERFYKVHINLTDQRRISGSLQKRKINGWQLAGRFNTYLYSFSIRIRSKSQPSKNTLLIWSINPQTSENIDDFELLMIRNCTLIEINSALVDDFYD